MSADKKKQKTLAEWEKNQQTCLKSLKAIMKKPTAGVFLVPVDWKALQLPLYPKLIKNPMDLGTVQQKLESNRYAKVEDFIADVGLVWKNAMIFNADGSDIYEVASQLEKEFTSKLEVTTGPLREKGASGPSSGPPTKGASSSSAPGKSGGKGGLEGEALAQCKAAVKELRKHKDAQVFNDPVDWKALGILDYPTIIKRPMDLGTVMKRLDGGGYASVQAVVGDVDLVWQNAMTYNQDESYIYQVAAELKSFADKKLAPLLAAYKDANVPTEVTFEMKRQLNEHAAMLSTKDLYGMLVIVEESCSRATMAASPQEVEIDLDQLDLDTFLKVERFVQDCITKAHKKNK